MNFARFLTYSLRHENEKTIQSCFLLSAQLNAMRMMPKIEQRKHQNCYMFRAVSFLTSDNTPRVWERERKTVNDYKPSHLYRASNSPLKKFHFHYFSSVVLFLREKMRIRNKQDTHDDEGLGCRLGCVPCVGRRQKEMDEERLGNEREMKEIK